MIVAQKRRMFEHTFNVLNRWLLFQSFHRIYIRMPSSEIQLQRPTVYYVNHSNWWDALLIFQLNYSLLRQQAHGMMSEEGLKQFPFFRKLGVYSINRKSLRDIKQSLDYTVGLLQEPDQSVWIFPQGDVFHQESRPLTFLPGIGYLLEKCVHAQWIPVTFYYSYGLVRQPDIYIEFGTPLPEAQLASRSRSERLTYAQDVLTQQLDRLREDVLHHQVDHFHPIWTGLAPTRDRFPHILRHDRVEHH